MAGIKLSYRNNSGNTGKVKMSFDISMLNTIIKYALKETLSKTAINNLYQLFEKIDIKAMDYNESLQEKAKIIMYIAQARSVDNVHDPEVIKAYISNKDQNLKSSLEDITWEYSDLNASTTKMISTNIDERLQFIYIFEVKDKLIKLFDKMETMDFISYYEIVENLRSELSQLMVKIQNTTVGTGMMRKLSFSDEDFFDEMVDVILQKSRKSTYILQTGMRQMNAILSPGFFGGRFYVYLGMSGKFKSGTLLNLADQIRKFNPQIKAVEDGRRKCLLFVTMENSIEETFERLFDMYSGVNDELKNMNIAEIKQILKEKGKYFFTEEDGIDIEFRYFSNLEINTADLYAIIQELKDNGKEPIGLILDYLKKIESTRPNNGDERVRLSNTSKELKALAFYFGIPVITAMQINRNGNSVVDAAMREGKQDLLNFVGASDIGVCWDIVEEADWVGIVSLERQISTGKLFLSCKRVKIRGKKDLEAMDYFNHPFANEKEIRLETDVDKPFPVSIISLASDLETVDTKEMEKNGQIRPTFTSIKGGASSSTSSKAKNVNNVLSQIKANNISLDNLVAV